MRLLLLAILLLPVLGAEQMPRPEIRNAKQETRSASQGLEGTIRTIAHSQNGPLWIGYTVPSIERKHGGNESWRGCRCWLEDGSRQESSQNHSASVVRLEGPSGTAVLLRYEKGQIGRVAVTGVDCVVDVGGLPLYWLEDVNPSQSIHLLSGFMNNGTFGKEIQESSVMAIAMHLSPDADAALESLVQPDRPESLRRNTVFWLGSSRGRRGYEILNRVMEHDPSTEVRSQTVFALSINSEPQALQAMIRAAKSDGSSHVRGQALFWLAQKAQQKAAVEAITDAVENDPETEVKKKAVFAVSQMPPEQGTPLLIRLAQTNKNREVRKQAMFWLGQSRDPRALQFFEQVLAR